MIPWILFAVWISALIALAAYTLGHTTSASNIPRRFLWAAALAAAVALPLVMTAWTRSRPAPILGKVVNAAPGTPQRSLSTGAARKISSRTDMFNDSRLSLLWLATSAVIIARLVRSHRRLTRMARQGTPATVDGYRVHLTHNLGPAAVSYVHPIIVVPEWVLTLSPSLRRLIFEHEAEHLRAGDQYLLLLGSAACALFPWNPALWWLSRRLRAAVELDCDDRVVVTADVSVRRRYAELLVLVAAHREGLGSLAAAFRPGGSGVSQRVAALLIPAAPSSRSTRLAATTASIAFFVTACVTEAPRVMLPSFITPAASDPAHPPLPPPGAPGETPSPANEPVTLPSHVTVDNPAGAPLVILRAALRPGGSTDPRHQLLPLLELRNVSTRRVRSAVVGIWNGPAADARIRLGKLEPRTTTIHDPALSSPNVFSSELVGSPTVRVLLVEFTDGARWVHPGPAVNAPLP